MHILSILQQLPNLLSYFNKFDSREQISSNPMMVCNETTGGATCQNGEARHRGKNMWSCSMWMDLTSALKMQSIHNTENLNLQKPFASYHSYLKKTPGTFHYVNWTTAKKFPVAYSFSSHDASKINTILEIHFNKYILIKYFAFQKLC